MERAAALYLQHCPAPVRAVLTDLDFQSFREHLGVVRGVVYGLCGGVVRVVRASMSTVGRLESSLRACGASQACNEVDA